MEATVRTFGHWLANEIDKRDWQQSDLVERLGVKPGVVSSWINGKRRPSYESCLEIARALQLDPEIVVAMAGRETTSGIRQRPLSMQEMLDALQRNAPVAVPIVEQAGSAGPGVGALQGYLYMERERMGDSKVFAMPVVGACMDPIISDGDIIVVDPELLPTPLGKIAVVSRDDEQVLVKRLVEYEGKRWLKPERGEIIPVDRRIRFIGTVVEIRKRA